MKTSDFSFDLPEKLIAQNPSPERGQSRLMVMDRKSGRLEHRMVRDLPSIVESGTVMVFNNSRVRKARIFGVSEKTGSLAEFLLLKKLDSHSWQIMAKRTKRIKAGNRYVFDDAIGEILPVSEGRAEGILCLRFDKPIDDAWLDMHGQVPLPPYIKRPQERPQAEAGMLSAGALVDDAERYQTVYAEEYGSAAAPTAGLHYTKELLGELNNAGIETVFITLHVGLGTFLPVRAENIEDHRMHGESFFIDDDIACRIEKAKREGRKILAVGTTSVRTLESAWTADGQLQRGEGNTSIFIYPGYEFKVVDTMFTNFHTPESTLLMLVSAFAGRDFVLHSYKEAVKEGYRFFSYGDACLIK